MSLCKWEEHLVGYAPPIFSYIQPPAIPYAFTPVPFLIMQVSYGDGTLPFTEEQVKALCWVRYHVRCSSDQVLIYKYNTCWCTSATSPTTMAPTTKPSPTTPSPTTPSPTTPPPTTPPPLCPGRYTYNEITGLCDCPFGKVYDRKINRCVCPRGHIHRYNRHRRINECVCPLPLNRQLAWHLYKCCPPGQVLDDKGYCVCPVKDCPSGHVSHGK